MTDITTPNDYADEIAALELCKEYLWDGCSQRPLGSSRFTFLCFALSRVSDNNANLLPAVDLLKHWIVRQLEKYGTAEAWLKIVHGIDSDDLDDESKMQAWRRAWVDHMIGILKS